MSDVFAAAEIYLTPSAILLMMLGTSLGVVVGAMPGLTGAMLIALSLPLTFSMSGEHALVLLVSMYVGSVSGGLITATLLKIPGTPASMMTTFDGYPMAQQGQARRALGLGISASLIGGLVSWFVLVCLCGPLARLSLKLGPFEFFALVMMAMVLIASVSGQSLLRGIFAGMLGVLCAMPGTSPATGLPRWTGGFSQLDDGFKLLPVLIGLFAISQVIQQLTQSQAKTAPADATGGTLASGLTELARHKANVVRSSLVGTCIGILPGIGANIGSVVAYSMSRGISRNPEEFGHGSPEGIIASEAANNATVGGALIPLIAMGIPGSVIDAILLGALTIHGLQPGPLLMEQNPQAVSVIIVTMLCANLFMFAFMLVTVRWIAKLTAVPQAILLPVILTLCVVGSYALANRMFDVWVMLLFGAIGHAMERWRIPVAPCVIGFVLAPIAEAHLTEGLMQSGGRWQPLFTRPMALLFLCASLATLVVTVMRHGKNRNNIRSTNR